MSYFEDDAPLKAWVQRRAADAETLSRLRRWGELAARLDPTIEAAHRDDRLPTLERFDRWGERIDEIRYCPEQLEARRLILESGVLTPVPRWQRLIAAYLFNQNGEGGVTCPLAMTDGLALLLEEHGSEEQRRRYEPLVRDPRSPTPLTGGQFVTEKQGGSVVSENRTTAVQAADGTWRLTGLKWFCSNPGDLWVTTAKPEGSRHVALFLVPRRLPDGTLNECHILRLKEICGSRGKATAEVEYHGAYAELVGKPSHGLAILMRTVIRTSRLHVAAGSLGMMRRALREARKYADERFVLGEPASKLPAIAESLGRMDKRWRLAQLAYFDLLDRLDADDAAVEALVPLLKMKLSEAATAQVRDAQLILAGNGILRDFSILPRLSQDALVQEIWEGTHPVLAGHVEKAAAKPACSRRLREILGRRASALDAGGLALCDALYSALTAELAARANLEHIAA